MTFDLLPAFDTNPFEPQSDGVGTIFLFWVDGNPAQNGYRRTPLYTSTGFHSICYHETRKYWDLEEKTGLDRGKRGDGVIEYTPRLYGFQRQGATHGRVPSKTLRGISQVY